MQINLKALNTTCKHALKLNMEINARKSNVAIRGNLGAAEATYNSPEPTQDRISS